jgi:hypothetical protein
MGIRFGVMAKVLLPASRGNLKVPELPDSQEERGIIPRS